MGKENDIHALAQVTPEQAKKYIKITDNQWNVYFYLLSESDYNSIRREDHRYVYRSKISPTKVAKSFGFSTRTYYNILEALQKKGLIDNRNSEYILLPLPRIYTIISRKLLSQLLSYRTIVGIDLLRTFLMFKMIDRDYGANKALSLRNIVRCLGHSDKRMEYYDKVQVYIDLLANWKLIDFHTEWREMPNVGKYRVYIIDRVYDASNELDLRCAEKGKLLGNGDLTEQEENHIKKLLGNPIEKEEEN